MNALAQFVETDASSVAAQLQWLKSLLRGETSSPPSASDDRSPLADIAERFRLSPFARALLLLAAAPDLDTEVADLLAARDARRPWPTLALARQIFDNADAAALAPDAPLRAFDLVHFGGEGALMLRPLFVNERVVFALHGIDTLDAWLTPWLAAVPGKPSTEPGQSRVAHLLAQALADNTDPLVTLTGASADERYVHVLDAARLLHAEALRFVVPEPSQPDPDPGEFIRRWRRETALTPRVLLIEADEWPARWLRALEQISTCVVAADTPPPLNTSRPNNVVRLPANDVSSRVARWRSSHPELAQDTAIRLAAEFRHAPERLNIVAADEASASEACRALTHAGMAGLGERIDAQVGWDELVLPPEQTTQLHDLALHAAARVVVGEAWGFAQRNGRGNGIAALFSGPPGTGKTLAARIVANAIGHDLYRVDLSRVVSKYVGETEKNLARVFDAADAGGAVLLFDEADALFGKRSEVKDSHDRYANLEIAYLLQRVEAFNGLAILTSNLDQALDAAFLRRLAFVVRFPFPGEAARRDIWSRAFPAAAPVASLDIDRLARMPLAGGHISGIAWSAACRAAHAGSEVQIEHVIAAARAECAKLEKPWQESWLRGNAR